MPYDLTFLARAARGCLTGCALVLAAISATAHAQPPDVSDGAPPLAQHAPDTAFAEPKMDAATLDALLGHIEAFGFHLRNDGGGAMVSVRIYPVLLFRSGDALLEIALLDPAHVDPSTRRGTAWTRWRRSDGKLEIEGKDGWEALAFPKIYSALPSDMRLDGRYRHVAGRDTTGGATPASAGPEYRFFADGRVIQAQRAGTPSQGQEAAAASGSVAPERHGRYRIEGLTLRIDYEDGREERRFLVADPALPHGAIWIDGVSHARRRH